MAEHFKLKGYKAQRVLDKEWGVFLQKNPRRIKYTMVDSIPPPPLQIPIYIAFANDYGAERVQWVDKAVRTVQDAKIHLRVMLDVRAINEHQYAVIMEKQENLSRQLNGWQKSLVKREKD